MTQNISPASVCSWVYAVYSRTEPGSRPDGSTVCRLFQSEDDVVSNVQPLCANRALLYNVSMLSAVISSCVSLGRSTRPVEAKITTYAGVSLGVKGLQSVNSVEHCHSVC